jgi:1-phosphofructokinase family hexose kinase
MIYTLTLNPAVDRELTVPGMQFDSVLRASASRVDFGGKGFNVSRLLQKMGTASTAIGFVGGRSGELLQDGLRSLGIKTDFVWIAGETRTNVSIVSQADNHYIKVNETGPFVEATKQAELINKIETLAVPGDWWVLAGSLPAGVEADYYARIIRILRMHEAQAVLDTNGEPLRLACAEGPYLVKPNAEEARAITGMPTGSAREVAAAAREIQRMGAANVVISMGEVGGLLKNETEAWLARAPVIEQKNPIGAGDSMVGGLAWALSQGFTLGDALTWGVASGAATASLSGTEVGSRPLIEQLRSRVSTEQI